MPTSLLTTKRILTPGTLTGLVALIAPAILSAAAPQVSIHDPVMAKEGDTYFLYSTGPGITFYSSKDLHDWHLRGRIFPDEPAWAKRVAPKFNGHIWAPDIIQHQGSYFLYYSVSSFGANTSAIGVTINKSLDPTSPDYRWQDQGIVIQSVPGRDLWNAIDPNVYIEDNGTPWLTFGSFWSGLKLVKLSPDLCRVAEPQEWHTLARRERPAFTPDTMAGPAEIEAPFIYKKGSKYYLFVSWDKCCQGAKSTYKIAVGRADKITGPYLDRNGNDMAEGGGTVLLKGDDEFAGVGHNSVYNFDGKDYLIFHAYENADHGLQKLKILELQWDEAGWPRVPVGSLHHYRSRLID